MKWFDFASVPAQSHGGAGCFQRSDPTNDDRGWPARRRYDHNPSQCSLAPFSLPGLPLPVEPSAGPDIADVWSHRTSWRRASDTKPGWFPVWRRKRPLRVLYAPIASRFRRGWRARDCSTAVSSRKLRPQNSIFRAAKYSFCSNSSWFTEPVTYASNRAHFLSFIQTAYVTLGADRFGFLTISRLVCLDLDKYPVPHFCVNNERLNGGYFHR